MIRLGQAVLVEGRYDKIKLDSVVDAIVLTTDGFNIFRDKEKQALVKRLAAETGLIVLTDSDEAGFKIRKFISDITGDTAYHAYVPEQPGKERRKTKAGAAGLIGVEGMDATLIEQALERCIQINELDRQKIPQPKSRPVTVADLYEDGLSGKPGAAQRRMALLRAAGLPARLSTKALRDILSQLYGYEEYKKMVNQL